MIAIRPSTAWAELQDSRNHCEARVSKDMTGMAMAYQKFKECNQTDHGERVRNHGHRRTKSWAALVEHEAEGERNEEHDEQDGGVPDDRAKGDNGKTNERARRVDTIFRERLDEKVRDRKDDGQAQRGNDFAEQDRAPTRTGNIARQLF